MKLANIATLATASIGLSTLAVSNVNAINWEGGSSSTGGSATTNGGINDGLKGTTTTDIPTMVQNWVNYFLGFIALLAVIYGIYGGFLYLTAGGNDESVKKAKSIFKQVAIGLFVVFISYSVVTFLTGSVFTAGNGSN